MEAWKYLDLGFEYLLPFAMFYCLVSFSKWLAASIKNSFYFSQVLQKSTVEVANKKTSVTWALQEKYILKMGWIFVCI